MEAGEVHLWWYRVDQEGEASDDELSPDERCRAERFHDPAAGRRYRAQHAFLRRTLAGLTGGSPAGLAFAAGEHGKPRLQDSELEFNLSHAGELALLGVARRPLGVDVERHQVRGELLRMAARVFTAEEAAALEALPEAGRAEAFFRGWTRKEAALKATGDGLARPPRTLAVGLDAGTSEGYRPVGGLPEFTLRDVRPPEQGYSACVCAFGSDWTLVEHPA